jgi:hypothetical protein
MMPRNLCNVDGLMVWFVRVSGGRGRGLPLPGRLGSGSCLRDKCSKANLLTSKLELWVLDQSAAPFLHDIMLASFVLFSSYVFPATKNIVSSTNADFNLLGSVVGSMRSAL